MGRCKRTRAGSAEEEFIMQSEIEFIESIDSSFPYHNVSLWKDITLKGIQISDNAAYMVLHEICRAPVEIDRQSVRNMIKFWAGYFSHPLAALVTETAKAIVDNISLSKEEILRSLDEISKYKGQYNALNIVYNAFTGDDREVDAKFSTILESWE